MTQPLVGKQILIVEDEPVFRSSGGDAPGMNAAIRGVVRSALTEGLEVMGIYDGYLGLYEDRMVQLDRYSVSDMINRGGTFLGSARFPEFRE